jgi:hypothetical protein
MVAAMSEVSLPAMRAEVIDAVKALADRPYQQHVWVQRQYPRANYYDDLSQNIAILYDDAQVLPHPSKAIGTILRSADEARALAPLGAALDAVFGQLGTERPDSEYLASPLWDRVVQAAGAAAAHLTG